MSTQSSKNKTHPDPDEAPANSMNESVRDEPSAQTAACAESEDDSFAAASTNSMSEAADGGVSDAADVESKTHTAGVSDKASDSASEPTSVDVPGVAARDDAQIHTNAPVHTNAPANADDQSVVPPSSASASRLQTAHASSMRASASAAAKSSTVRSTNGAEPRRVALVVSRVDPWTVLKVTFVLSFVLAIATIIAALLVWLLLNSLHVFADIRDFVGLIDDSGSIAKLVDYLKLPRFLALTAFVGVANVILMSAFATIGAMVYNIASSLVGGIKVVLMDE